VNSHTALTPATPAISMSRAISDKQNRTQE